MAICDLCGEPMDGRPCPAMVLPIGRYIYRRLSFGEEEWSREHYAATGHPDHCHDCLTPWGGTHHWGCDLEQCPHCLGQLLSCDCDVLQPADDEEAVG